MTLKIGIETENGTVYSTRFENSNLAEITSSRDYLLKNIDGLYEAGNIGEFGKGFIAKLSGGKSFETEILHKRPSNLENYLVYVSPGEIFTGGMHLDEGQLLDLGYKLASKNARVTSSQAELSSSRAQ